MALSATLDPMLIKDKRDVKQKETKTARRGNVLPRVDLGQPSAEWQAVVASKRPYLTRSDGCLADSAVCQAEDDEEDHHVQRVRV